MLLLAHFDSLDIGKLERQPDDSYIIEINFTDDLTAMKTLSMYIRAAKTEAEDAGIATDGMASSVSELRQEILALTGGQVDIMIDDTNFKSTYQIIEELAGIWGTLEETTQANITELIGGGVKNANVISALMSNFAKAEDVLTTSLNSAGSAISENEKYLESIAGKISQFKAAWQDLSNTLIDSTLIKAIVDFGTGLMNLVDNIGEFLGSFGTLMASIPLTVAAFQKFTILQSIFTGLRKSISNFVGGAKGCPFEYAHYTVVVTLNESRCDKAVYSK